MKKKVPIKFLILSTNIFAILLLGGCLDNLNMGNCPEPEEEITRRVYSVTLDGQVEAVEPDWKRHFGIGDIVEMHGLDSLRNYLYFSDHNSYGMIRINYRTNEQAFYSADGKNFDLSPDGTRFVYEKTMNFNSIIYIDEILQSTNTWFPSDTMFQVTGLRFPEWETDNMISFSSKEGIFLINQNDSTIQLITKIQPSSGYDISLQNENIVFSNLNESGQYSDDAVIYFQKGFNKEIKPLKKGVYPVFIPNTDKFLYETISEIMISDFDANTEILYKKPESDYYNSYNKKKMALSPNGEQLAITLNDGVYLIDITSKKIQKIVDTSYFVSEDWESPSNESSFVAPIFASDGSKIFFSITLKEVHFGC